MASLLTSPLLVKAEKADSDLPANISCFFTYKDVNCSGSGDDVDQAQKDLLKSCPAYYKLPLIERNNAWGGKNPKTDRDYLECFAPGGVPG